MIRDRIRAGIEIETIFNPKFLGEKLKKAGYEYNRHNGHLKFWKIKGDCSVLDINDEFTDETDFYDYDEYDDDDENQKQLGIEFESSLLYSKKSFFKALDEFKRFCDYENNELKNVLSFNETCGNHLHIGFKDNNKNYSHKLSFSILKKARKLFFKKIENSEKLSNDTKEKIKSQYFRSYARELNKADWDELHPNRYLEFNKRSEYENKGLEWRSFNLRDAKTWGEFDELFKIGYEILEFLWDKRTGGFVDKTTHVKLDKKYFKKLIKLRDGTA